MPTKIFIMTDMEGVSGICNYAQTDPASPHYEAGRLLLCADVNSAIAGAFDGGADEVVVSDGHHSGFNFILEKMDPRATYLRPNGRRDYLHGLDDSFAGAFGIGYHAMAGTPNAFLDHTQNDDSWFNYSLNGRPTGELGQVGAWAGHYDVPMLFVSGDQAACDEARDFFGNIETVAVKQGIGRMYARCIHPERAHVNIRQTAKRAMGLIGTAQPYRIDLPLTIRLELFRTDQADQKVTQQLGVERVNSRTVERVVDDVRHLLCI